MPLITDKDWLDPILPEELPASIIERADTLPGKAAFLAGRLARQTSEQLGQLLQITNSYYSNLIEGRYTEIAMMQQAQTAPRRERLLLQDLAIRHMQAQEVFERALRRFPPAQWSALFEPALVQRVHRRLFDATEDASRRLDDGRLLRPGQLRARPDEEVSVGGRPAPAAAVVLPMLRHLRYGFGRIHDPRRRLIGALAYHHRLAFVHPFLDGNGRTTRLMTHLHLVALGLRPTLWSLSRGLARQHQDYYRMLALADRPREGDLDGRGKLSRKHYFAFIEFMLDVCHDQIDYMTQAVDPAALRERVVRAFRYNAQLRAAGAREESAAAMHALLVQGEMPRSDFKTFTGLTPRPAIDELSRLIRLGVVLSPTPKSRSVQPGLPTWFAQEIFPDLHRRFQ